eukprot:jgi/Tetstr1/438468/TSEL_027023.t1
MPSLCSEQVPAGVFLRLTETSGAHGFVWDAERDEAGLSAGWKQTLGCSGRGRPSNSSSWRGLLASFVAAPADAVAVEAWAAALPGAVLSAEVGVLTQAAPGPVPARITAECYGEGANRRLAGSVRLLGGPAATPGCGYSCRPEPMYELTAATTAERQDLELSRARAANKAKSAFLANMSHEMRTPLNGIIGVNQVLLSGQLERDQRELVELTQSSADSLLKLINDILDLERIESGQLDLECTDFDIATTVEESLDTVMMIAAKKKLEVISYIDPEINTLLRGDSGRIKQILLNLLSNAVKFTKSGEIVVSCEKDTIETESQVSLLVKVTDSGIGISKAAQAKLFNRFTQAEASTTRRFGGTGLGLAICKQLVGMMNGNIGIHSNPGHGSTFWFTMTLDKHGPMEPHVASGASPLLVVANHPRERAVLQAYLESFGAREMSIVPDVESARAVLAASPALQFRALIAAVPADDDSAAQLSTFCEEHCAAIGRAVVMAPITALSAMREKRRDWMVLSKPIKRGTLAALLRNIAEGEGPVLEGTRRSPPPRANVLLAADGPPCPGLQDMITRAGYTCDVTSNASDALAAIRSTVYSAVLMDKAQDPVVPSAPRSVRNVEQELQRGRVPVIGVYNGSDSDSDDSAVDDVIRTPVNEAALGLMLKKWTRSGQLYDTLLRTGLDRDSMRQDTVQQARCTSPEDPHARQVRILLAEDSPANQLVIVRTVTHVGRKLLGKEPVLVVVGDGDEAVRAAEEGPFDLVLMDLNMPCMGGVEATQLIRKKYTQDEMPIVALTATDDLETLGLEHEGFNGAVRKPLAPASLMNVLREHLKSIPRDSEGQPLRLNASSGFMHPGYSAQSEEATGGPRAPWEASGAKEGSGSVPRVRRRDPKTKAFWKAFEKEEEAMSPSLSLSPPQTANVLLVEDSVAYQLTMQRSIKQNGRELLGAEPELTTCSNGAEALQAMEKQRFDLVFMDLHMPVMGGLRAVKEIRKTYPKDTLPVVAITASEDPATGDDTSSSRIMGHFNEIVAKPTSDENMKAIFKRHLTKKAACGRSARISKPAVGRPHVAPSAATDACAAANPIRCLVVEDDKVSRVMMARLLKAAGISMLEAHDGMEGVKQATSAEVDIILMDCDMPVKDGWQATREIRAWEAATSRTRTPIIACSARAMAGDREHCLSVGMDDHVPKPVKNAELMDVIAKYLKAGGDSPAVRTASRASTCGGSPPPGSRCALLVDECLATAVDTQGMLEAEGLMVEVVENGLQAVEAFEAASGPQYEVVLMSGKLAIATARDTAAALLAAAERCSLVAPPLVLLRQAAAGDTSGPKASPPKPAGRSSVDVRPPFKYSVQLPMQADQLSMVLTCCGLKSSGTLPDVRGLRPFDGEALIGKLCLLVDSSADAASVLRSLLAPVGISVLHLADPAQLPATLAASSYSVVLLHHPDSAALLAAVRAHSPDLPVVVLPATHRPEDLLDAAPSTAALSQLPFSARRTAILGALFRLTAGTVTPEDASRRSSFQPQPPLELAHCLTVFAGDWPLALERLQGYADNGAAQLAAIALALAATDMTALHAVSDELAGASRGCGIERVASLCDRLGAAVEARGGPSSPQLLAILASQLQGTLLETAAFVTSLSHMATMDIARGLVWAGGDLPGLLDVLLGALQRTWSELQDKEAAIRGGDVRVVVDMTAGLMGPEVAAAAPRLFAAASEARQVVQADGHGHNALRLMWRELERLRVDLKLLRGTVAVQLRGQWSSRP